ncbi:MAG: VIT domain-containing protein [Anaerolineae bacterium]
MKTKVMALALAALMTVALVTPISADGIIIIEPPPEPPPDWRPWLTIRYHRVHVTLEGQVATTRVDQAFRNDGPTAAEGTYVFPLPPGAVVEQFTMWVDGKPVDARILESAEARTIYEDYVRRRRDPALLEYVGRDAVQARIFPIPPGEERRVELQYRQLLPLEDSTLHYHYPLNTERFSDQPLEEVSIFVEVKADEPLRALYSPTHQDELLIQRQGERYATLSYEATHLYPNRDFELYAGFDVQEIGAKLLTHRPTGEEDGFFLLILSPGVEVEPERVLSRDLFLVLDTSGSMEGEKLSQAKEALNYVLRHLNPEDRFNVVSFSSDVRAYAPAPRAASEAPQALEWAADLEALGGTNIYQALTETLQQVDPQRTTVVIFLTDGMPTEGITDEQMLLSTLQKEAPKSVRIFPFGVGYDVNTLLLDQLAENHNGRPTYVEPEERIDEQVSAFYERMQRPLLTDITLDYGGIATYDVYPAPLPDLYAGTQLVLTGRYRGAGPEALTLTGEVAGRRVTYSYEVNFDAGADASFIPRLWAARKIGHLLTQIRLHGEEQEWIDAVVTLSLRYGIITPYTSFLIQEEDALTTKRREGAEEAFRALPTPGVAGQTAVEEAEVRLGLGGAQAPPATDAERVGLNEEDAAYHLRYVEDKAFLCDGERCTDSRFVPDKMSARTLRFRSEAYWQLLEEHPTWGKYLALAPEVIFIAPDGEAYHVRPDAGEEALPEVASPTPDLTATPVPQEPAQTTTPSDASPELCSSALLGLLLLLLGAWVLRS